MRCLCRRSLNCSLWSQEKGGGRTILVYDRQPLLSDDELQELSIGRNVVVHQSIDSVMFARTALWQDGEFRFSAVVDHQVDDDVVITGDNRVEKELVRSSFERVISACDYHDDLAPTLYDHVAEIARSQSGFRHDRPLKKSIRFHKLVDHA